MRKYSIIHLERACSALKSMSHTFTLSDFDYHLPPGLIAQHPSIERSGSRLLDGRVQPPEDCIFNTLPQLLRPGDLLIFNDTKVIKARLFGSKPSGGKLEILIERVLPNHPSEPKNRVIAHMKVSKKPSLGSVLHMAGGQEQGGFDATLLSRWPDEKGALFCLGFSDDPFLMMQMHGHVPLPPYIAHNDSTEDESRYQTVFARRPGAAAAPTAALHFDQKLFENLENSGIYSEFITLHVGAGTFQPVKTENIYQHQMHSEWYEIPEKTIAAIAKCKEQGGRVVAVGTTTVRTLESWALTGHPHGDTQIFITPGFEFRVVDLLITNFHLPKSTLLMLVSAFCGHQKMKSLYQHAIEKKYKFFSYGDAMLIEHRVTSQEEIHA
jgi:S-adenosylmethionine:tRNA ribosyltransferase-isomerase